jgi:putative membrane protein
MGPGGFALFCLWSLANFLLLGGAWLAGAQGEPARRLGLFSWGRMVREAVSDLLPFSQLGGIVVGTRTLAARGIATSRLYASLVVDLTTEMAGQIVFTLVGLAIMASLLAGNGAATALRPAILGGTAVMVAVMLLFFSMQHLALDITGRIAGRFVSGSQALMTDIRAELARIYTHRARVWLAFALNLAAWVTSATGAWLALMLMGVQFSFWNVMALESLIFALRSVAFVIPGALGVQEATYAIAAPLFGLPPETALALSLAKRARDLAIGLPTLLLWQAFETRALVGALASGRRK